MTLVLSPICFLERDSALLGSDRGFTGNGGTWGGYDMNSNRKPENNRSMASHPELKEFNILDLILSMKTLTFTLKLQKKNAMMINYFIMKC